MAYIIVEQSTYRGSDFTIFVDFEEEATQPPPEKHLFGFSNNFRNLEQITLMDLPMPQFHECMTDYPFTDNHQQASVLEGMFCAARLSKGLLVQSSVNHVVR